MPIVKPPSQFVPLQLPGVEPYWRMLQYNYMSSLSKGRGSMPKMSGSTEAQQQIRGYNMLEGQNYDILTGLTNISQARDRLQQQLAYEAMGHSGEQGGAMGWLMFGEGNIKMQQGIYQLQDYQNQLLALRPQLAANRTWYDETFSPELKGHSMYEPLYDTEGLTKLPRAYVYGLDEEQAGQIEGGYDPISLQEYNQYLHDVGIGTRNGKLVDRLYRYELPDYDKFFPAINEAMQQATGVVTNKEVTEADLDNIKVVEKDGRKFYSVNVNNMYYELTPEGEWKPVPYKITNQDALTAQFYNILGNKVLTEPNLRRVYNIYKGRFRENYLTDNIDMSRELTTEESDRKNLINEREQILNNPDLTDEQRRNKLQSFYDKIDEVYVKGLMNNSIRPYLQLKGGLESATIVQGAQGQTDNAKAGPEAYIQNVEHVKYMATHGNNGYVAKFTEKTLDPDTGTFKMEEHPFYVVSPSLEYKNRINTLLFPQGDKTPLPSVTAWTSKGFGLLFERNASEQGLPTPYLDFSEVENDLKITGYLDQIAVGPDMGGGYIDKEREGDATGTPQTTYVKFRVSIPRSEAKKLRVNVANLEEVPGMPESSLNGMEFYGGVPKNEKARKFKERYTEVMDEMYEYYDSKGKKEPEFINKLKDTPELEYFLDANKDIKNLFYRPKEMAIARKRTGAKEFWNQDSRTQKLLYYIMRDDKDPETGKPMDWFSKEYEPDRWSYSIEDKKFKKAFPDWVDDVMEVDDDKGTYNFNLWLPVNQFLAYQLYSSTPSTTNAEMLEALAGKERQEQTNIVGIEKFFITSQSQ